MKTDRTNALRKKRMRDRRKKLGLRRREFYLTDAENETIAEIVREWRGK